MKSRFFIAALIVIVGALLVGGCTDKTKDNPTRPASPEQGLSFLNSWSFYSLFFSTEKNAGYMPATALVPPGYEWQSGGGKPYPVLYMLSPFQGDDRYYFEHGLAEVANRLWSEGKIKPMIIVSIDGRSPLGGSFYVNSAAQGKYFTALTENEDFLIEHYYNRNNFPAPQVNITQLLKSHGLVNRLDDWYLTIRDPKARAISGVGMGGYGAFATVLKTGMFGSVSAINAPLDFDGTDGTGGFKRLIPEVFPGSFANFDTSSTNMARSLVVSAAAAFSPYYTGFTVDSVYDDQFGAQTFSYSPDDSLVYTYLDEFDSTVADLSTLLPQHQLQMPIDSSGNMDSPAAQFVWDAWMKQNIENLYYADADGQASNFFSMPKLLIESKNADFYYTDQMDGFIKFLDDIGDRRHTVIDFEGNSLLTGTADHFLYDLLEDILIFHSDHFELPSADATIGDLVWEDVNQNGIQDEGEPGIGGVEVLLVSCDDSLMTPRQATTDTYGHYIFTDVTPGNYRLHFTLREGLAFSPMDQGTDDSLDSDVDPNTGYTICTHLTYGKTDLTWDAGMYRLPTSIGGQ